MSQIQKALPKYIFSWQGAFALFLGAFVPTFVLKLINDISFEISGKDFQNNDFFVILMNAFMWLGAIWAFDRFVCRPQTGKKLSFDLSAKDFSTYLLIFPMMLGMMFIAEFFTSLIPIKGLFFGDMYDFFNEMMQQLTNDTATMIVLAVVMAPLFEEIVFRGIIQKGLINKGLDPTKAIWISALVFGLVHANPWQFVGATLLGFVLGTVYEKTGSLLLPILLHAFNNLASTLLIEFYGIESFSEAFNLSSLTLLGIGIVLFGIFYFLFIKKYQNTTKVNFK